MHVEDSGGWCDPEWSAWLKENLSKVLKIRYFRARKYKNNGIAKILFQGLRPEADAHPDKRRIAKNESRKWAPPERRNLLPQYLWRSHHSRGTALWTMNTRAVFYDSTNVFTQFPAYTSFRLSRGLAF